MQLMNFIIIEKARQISLNSNYKNIKVDIFLFVQHNLYL